MYSRPEKSEKVKFGGDVTNALCSFLFVKKITILILATKGNCVIKIVDTTSFFQFIERCHAEKCVFEIGF